MGQPREMRTVDADDAEICVESIGDAENPAVLLMAGAGSSMDWWEDDLCELLADGCRRVVRYDYRDTGRSTTWPAGQPGYTGKDLVGDAVAILDALSISAAHLVGLSMGGALAQLLALEHRERVASLTLVSTTLATDEVADLPGMTPELQAVFAGDTPEPDWADREAVIAHMVEVERPFAGPRSFSEQRMRTLAGHVYDRSIDPAAASNHFLLGEDDPGERRLEELEGLPALVIHGSADAMFPPAHGRALADSIPGARLIELEDVGHQYPPPRTWDRVVDAVIEVSGR